MSEQPTVNDVFSPQRSREAVTGTVSVYRPPRGAPSIQISAQDGRALVVPCLVAPDMCDAGMDLSTFTATATLTHISNRVYWPISIRFGANRTIAEDQSRMVYELYREREGSLYRVWIALSMAFAGFAVWFGKRPLLGVATGTVARASGRRRRRDPQPAEAESRRP